jgi:hypothetical protein
MTERMREEELVEWLTRLGEQWRERQIRPLTAEEKARARASLARAFAQIEAEGRPPLRERLARWWGMAAEAIRSLGVISAEGLSRRPALAFAEAEEQAGWSRTVRSDDGRLRGTLLVTSEQEVWVGFETEDPALAGAAVRFALLPEEGEEPAYQGEVRLEPVEEGVWEGRACLGRATDLGLEGECDLVFVA